MLCKFHFLLGNYHRMKCIQCQIYNHYNELNKLHRSYYLNNGLFCIMNNYWRKFHITSKMDRSFHILNHQDNIHFCKINNLCFLHLNNLHMDVHTAGNQYSTNNIQGCMMNSMVLDKEYMRSHSNNIKVHKIDNLWGHQHIMYKMYHRVCIFYHHYRSIIFLDKYNLNKLLFYKNLQITCTFIFFINHISIITTQTGSSCISASDAIVRYYMKYILQPNPHKFYSQSSIPHSHHQSIQKHKHGMLKYCLSNHMLIGILEGNLRIKTNKLLKHFVMSRQYFSLQLEHQVTSGPLQIAHSEEHNQHPDPSQKYPSTQQFLQGYQQALQIYESKKQPSLHIEHQVFPGPEHSVQGDSQRVQLLFESLQQYSATQFMQAINNELLHFHNLHKDCRMQRKQCPIRRIQQNIICKYHPNNNFIGKMNIQQHSNILYIHLDKLNKSFRHLSNNHQRKIGIEFQKCMFYIQYHIFYKLGYQTNIRCYKASMHYPLGIFLEDRMYNLNHYSNMTYNCLSNYNNVQMNSIE
ncbi:unnamed protein product [Paramecium primaurelia]|uniref:Uncharacterized protein n=1 Tax=Paramecium primaurelia TaxID=5886 RepID=A0A8S1MLY3_PARPR|nr:unnamed protein product [Paramecium primaurelia]